MALTIFLLFGFAVIVFGLVFVAITLRHHRENDRKLKEQTVLAQMDVLASERLP
jgi:signal transduction histidine kinase